MCVTSEGYIVHWKNSTEKTAWDYCTAELDIDNFVKVYTSHYIRKQELTERERRTKLDNYINRIAEHQASKGRRIIEVSITPLWDIVIGFAHSADATFYITKGCMTIAGKTDQAEGYTSSKEKWTTTCGPLVSEGLINYRNFQIICRNPPPGLPKASIAEYLNNNCVKLIEMQIEHLEKRADDPYLTAKGALTAYVRFSSLEEALNFPTEHEIEGYLVKLWHRGLLKCDTCGEQGHRADRHDQFTKAKERNQRKKQAYRSRRARRDI